MVTDYVSFIFMSLSSCSLPPFLSGFSNLVLNSLQELSAKRSVLAAYPVHAHCMMREVIILIGL